MEKGKQVSDVKCTHQIHSLLDYSCIHRICSAVSRQYSGHQKKWQMNTPMVKRQAFSHWRHKYAFCVPPEVKWTMENTSLFQTLYQKLCKLTSVTCLSLCSAGKPNARVRVSVLAPRSHGTPRQPIYKADHKLLEVMTAFYFSGYLKFTAGGKKSFSCLTSFYCVLHKMPKWKRFSHLPIVSNPLA